MQTAVADTSALISLGVPGADATYDTSMQPDPLQYLLTSCQVSIPVHVKEELVTTAQYDDIHAAAAANVLGAADRFNIEDPLRRTGAPDTLPTLGLDSGETAGIVLANVLECDVFLTDEFGGTNFLLIHAALAGPRLVPTPRLVCDFARGGHMTVESARELLSVMGQHRGWAGSAYVQQLSKTL